MQLVWVDLSTLVCLQLYHCQQELMETCAPQDVVCFVYEVPVYSLSCGYHTMSMCLFVCLARVRWAETFPTDEALQGTDFP